MLLTKMDILNKLVVNRGRKKCFIFDLDGTIVFDKKPLSIDNENILKRIVLAGHQVIFATGRPFRDFQTVMPKWTYDGCLILFGGGLSLEGQEVINSVCMPEQRVMELVEMCHENRLPYNVDNSYNYYHPEVFHDFYLALDHSAGMYKALHVNEVVDGKTHKVLILDISLEEMFREYAAENNLIIKFHAYDNWIDIVPIGVDKYSAVLPFIKNYHPEDVFVFGNDYNDYELLLNFHNSILFGGIVALQNISKINILYDIYLQANFETLVNTIMYQ